MPNEVLRNIRSVVGVTNNTYSQGSANLALSLEAAYLYYVTCVNFSIDTITALDVAFTIQWQVTRQSKSAIVGFDDNDVLWKGGYQVQQTTSGQVVTPLTHCEHQIPPYAVAMPELFFGILLTGGASDAICTFNLPYYPKKVSQKQFWEASQAR